MGRSGFAAGEWVVMQKRMALTDKRWDCPVRIGGRCYQRFTVCEQARPWLVSGQKGGANFLLGSRARRFSQTRVQRSDPQRPCLSEVDSSCTTLDGHSRAETMLPMPIGNHAIEAVPLTGTALNTGCRSCSLYITMYSDPRVDLSAARHMGCKFELSLANVRVRQPERRKLSQAQGQEVGPGPSPSLG